MKLLPQAFQAKAGGRTVTLNLLLAPRVAIRWCLSERKLATTIAIGIDPPEL